MKISIKAYRVRHKDKVQLKKWPTKVKAVYKSKADYEKILGEARTELSELQNLLYASDRHALLLIFQAMDAAGKDGVIKHVMSGVNPQGTQVFSFKHPSAEELDHDFLWRTTRSLPERGRIGIFNRSYYEEVLIVRVHPEILEGERLPEYDLSEEEVWEQRYKSINDLEKHLHRNGTRVVKFFLHISKEEQRKRFIARIDDPSKNWKFSSGDVKERKYWPQYSFAYQECISATSTEHAPWYVIPADDKETARLLVSKVVVETLRDMKMKYPITDATRKAELQAMRTLLEQESQVRESARSGRGKKNAARKI
jgi:PPK2 family polyphosphate:nucleotide phosphotransferase